MRLIERDYPGQTIEQIMLEAYRRCGTERAAADRLGVTQQTFNAWKFRLAIDEQFGLRASLAEQMPQDADQGVIDP
jgi:hypothetical protein